MHLGLRVAEYSRDELRRVALPGNAVSTLFWVIPLGRWRFGELDHWWRLFTQGHGPCRETGLLIVKDELSGPHYSRNEESDADRSEASSWARLDELMPNSGPKDRGREDRPRLLVLSGAYPQPGWAVELDFQRFMDPNDFERIVRHVMEHLRYREDHDGLAAITAAQRSFHVRNRTEPPRFNSQLTVSTMSSWTVEDLEVLESATSPRNGQDVVTSLSAILSRVRRINRSPEWDALHRDLRHSQRLNWMLSGSAPELAGMLRQPPGLGALPSPAEAPPELRSKEGRDFVGWFDDHRQEWPESTVEVLSSWAREVLGPRLLREASRLLAHERRRLEESLRQRKAAEALAQERHEDALRLWREERRRAEREYRATLAQASLAQWQLGPRFLVELERVASANGLETRSVAWDRARMVGWKLNLARPELNPDDLRAATSTLLKRRDIDDGRGIRPTALDGSVFADYAYYIVTSDPNRSARDATCELLRRLLNVGTLLTLSKGELGEDETHLASRLLERWGWPEEGTSRPEPLAGCVHRRDACVVELTRDPVAVRISLESGLKDLVAVALSTLGWSSDVVERELSHCCWEFRRSPGRTWSDELEQLTVGSANVLLRQLLPLAFPQATEASGRLVGVVSKVGSGLNAFAHDAPPLGAAGGPDQRVVAEGLEEIIALIHELVGELPWHMQATQLFGQAPAIATGRAWSHSHPEERVIRVLLSDGAPSSGDLVVWNPSRRNPVMTDAILISRAGASHRRRHPPR
jgi:hypothetical protein